MKNAGTNTIKENAKPESNGVMLGNCKQCDKPLKRKSQNGRFPAFCSSTCRVKHWRIEQRKEGSS